MKSETAESRATIEAPILRERIAESRRELLAAIGDPRDLTFVRTAGNIGDELIWAGTRRLLADYLYVEVPYDRLGDRRGHTALLTGGGGWCSAFHELIPQLLPFLERRFTKVVVLPSSFELAVAVVRSTLERTRATLFAREPVSLAQLRAVRPARLAVDCAFFFDFAPFLQAGTGVLEAFRRDREADPDAVIPPGNRDLSADASSLDEWLWTIARCAEVHTDRAHVMIAAALMGKRVRFRPSSYHKVPAIAEWLLSELDVRPLEASPQRVRSPLRAATHARTPAHRRRGVHEELLRQASANRPTPGAARGGSPRVTVVLISWNDLSLTLRALESLDRHCELPHRMHLVDNGSQPAVRDALAAWAESRPDVRTTFLSDNLGCAPVRAAAPWQVDTEFVLFIDNDVEIFPGTVGHLVQTLDENPGACAATPTVVLPTGWVHHAGGLLRPEGDLLFYELRGNGSRWQEAVNAPPVANCDWLGFTCALIRTDSLRRQQIDSEMYGYYEDLEWCWRVAQGTAGQFLACSRSLVIHHHRPKTAGSEESGELSTPWAVRYITSIARFYARHGLIIQNLFDFAPELGGPTRPGRRAARSFLDLFLAQGPEWMEEHWFRALQLADRDRPEVRTLALDLVATLREIARLRRKIDGIPGIGLWRRLARIRAARHRS